MLGTNETFKQGLFNPFHGSAIVEDELHTESKLAHMAFLQNDLQGSSLGQDVEMELQERPHTETRLTDDHTLA